MLKSKIVPFPEAGEGVYQIIQVTDTNARRDYLKGLAEEFGIPFYLVEMLADALGEAEDRDGLISELEDISMILEGMEDY